MGGCAGREMGCAGLLLLLQEQRDVRMCCCVVRCSPRPAWPPPGCAPTAAPWAGGAAAAASRGRGGPRRCRGSLRDEMEDNETN